MEKFDKSKVDTVGWVDLPRGGFKKVYPRLRVETYNVHGSIYGSIILSFNVIHPEDMKKSKPLAQAHLTPLEATHLIALLAVATKKVMPAMTLKDIWREAENIARKVIG